MAISFVGSSTGTVTGGSTTTDISLPSGVQEGDVIILATSADLSYVTTGNVFPIDYSVDEDWFPVLQATSGDDPTLHVAALLVGASVPANVRIRGAATNDAVVVMQAFRGVDKRIFDADTPAMKDNNSTPSSFNSITTNTNGAWVVAIAALDDDDTTVNSYPSGYSNTAEVNTGNASTTAGQSIAMCSKNVTTAGTESPASLTWNSSDNNKTAVLALQPDQDVVDNWDITEVGRVYARLAPGSTANSISLPSMQEGDVVIIFSQAEDNFVGSGRTDPVNTSGYTRLLSNFSPDFHVNRKVQGATPDTTVSMDGPSSTYAAAVSIVVFRGVDPDTPEDVSIAQASSAACPSVTTVTDNAMVIRGVCVDSYAQVGCAWPAGQAGFTSYIVGSTNQFDNAQNEAGVSMVWRQYDSAGATGTVSYNRNYAIGGGTKVFTLALRPLVPLTGTGAITLAAVAVSGTGTVIGTRTGIGAITLPAIAVSGVAEREIPGAGAITLGAITVSGAGTKTAEKTGTGAIVLPTIVVSGLAERALTGTGAIVLPAVTVSGAGAIARDATGAITLPAITVTGAGAIARDATGAIVLPALAVSGAAEREIPGTGAITLPAITVAGAGTALAEIDGSGAIVLPAITIAGVAERSLTGTGALTLGAIAVSGAGAIARDATGAITLPALTVSGAATRDVTASGSITLPGIVISGAGATVGDTTITGTGALTLPAAFVAGVAERSITASGAVVMPSLTVAGLAERAVTGSGAMTLPVTVIAGTAERTITGTGALTIPAALINGAGFLGEFITGRVVYAGASVTTSTLTGSQNASTLGGSVNTSTLGGSGNSSTIDDGGNSSTLASDGPNQTADEE